MRTRPSACEARERRRRAVELRLAGASYAQIAERLDYADASGPFRAVARSLSLGEGTADQLRELELARLDRLQEGVWPKAVAGRLQAVDAVLAIMRRRSRLLGLGRPAGTRSAGRAASVDGPRAVSPSRSPLNVGRSVKPNPHGKISRPRGRQGRRADARSVLLHGTPWAPGAHQGRRTLKNTA
jgi:hypothetical protein